MTAALAPALMPAAPAPARAHALANVHALMPVPGFENTDYALLQGRIVWAGTRAKTDHPRHAHAPWHPPTARLNATRLRANAALLDAALQAHAPKGLLLWLAGRPLPFPMQTAVPRFEAVRQALQKQDLDAFEAAALRVLGLGHGLTPSGDDFIGGVLFTLVHAPIKAWRTGLPAVKNRLHQAAQTATNPISAALLDDLMAGASYRALHDLLLALHKGHASAVDAAVAYLLTLGASSGADLLAGVRLALQTSSPQSSQP